MATTRQHKPRRPQRDNSAASQPRRTRPFSRPRPSCVSRVTGGAQLPGYRPLSGLLKLAHVPEQSCGLKYEAAQPCKPSVKWDLDSSTDYEIPAKVTSSSAATCCPNFRRDRLERRQEVSAGPGPQVIFLPPRTAHHPVLFRCAAGFQSVRQSPAPLREAELFLVRPAIPQPMESLVPEPRTPTLRLPGSLNFSRTRAPAPQSSFSDPKGPAESPQGRLPKEARNCCLLPEFLSASPGLMS